MKGGEQKRKKNPEWPWALGWAGQGRWEAELVWRTKTSRASGGSLERGGLWRTLISTNE